jgi:phosphatase NudJ
MDSPNRPPAARLNGERWAPSVTVAAIVEHDGRYLLVEEHTAEGLKLNNPAGHLDPGESPLQGVVREALEETARQFTPQAVLGLYMSRFVRQRSGDDVTYLRIAFCGTVGEADPALKLDTPIVRTLWMTPAEVRASVARHRSPLLLRCMEDHLAGKRFSLDVLQADASLWQPELRP